MATYEPVSHTLEIVHDAGLKLSWDMALLMRAIVEQHTSAANGVLAVPIISPDGRPLGVLAVRHDEDDHSTTPFAPSQRQTLRAASERIAAELERRRITLLDDVLDGLLRKTKPIDVYTHALRELRRFIRYDVSASVMTMQRGMSQLTVRVEKVVHSRGEADTLLDSPRRGRIVRMTPAQSGYLTRLDRPIELLNDGDGWQIVGAPADPDAAGLWRALALGDGAQEGSVLCYPLIFGGQTLGILRLAAQRAHAFDPIDQYAHLLHRFAGLLAVTLYRSELYHQSDWQLQAIKEIGRAITEPISVEEICDRVLRLALRVLHVPVGAVGLVTDEGALELVTHQGCTEEVAPALSLSWGISGEVVRTGRSRVVSNVHEAPDYVVLNNRVCSELVAPITYDREVIGFLDVESYETGRFREEDEEVITFLEALANQAAIAIKTAQLHAETVRRLGASMSIDPTLSMAGLQDLLIQELRDKNEQLAAANDRLAIANRTKSEFLAHMSHDLRGPLNVIVGLANLLTDPSVAPTLSPQKHRESLEIIRSSGEVLASLIGTILDLSKLEAGKVDLNVAPFHAETAFSYLRAMATTLAEDRLHQLDIVVDLHPSIVTINADEDKFLRIMINLISNAVKFTPSGGRIVVRASVVDGSDLHVRVEDTGIGIPPEQHDRVFQPFQRIEGTASGTGLGLAVVRQLVELHGGRVWLESTPGVGSIFHALFPSALAAPTGDAGVSMEPLGATGVGGPIPRGVHTLAGSGGTSPSLAGAWTRGIVLVVEDTEAHMNLMRLAVTSRGYSMHGVGSGEEALEWLENHRPDIILLDMQLPGIDGFAVAARIKERVETHSIPVIAVTANALAAYEERAIASGCDAYLTKPIDIGILLATMESVCT
ncbi:MAG: hypothetical protein NVSMB52_15270 [Chloroflexota bacterium]